MAEAGEVAQEEVVEISVVVEVAVVAAVVVREEEGLEGQGVFEELLITLPSSSRLSQRRDFHKRWLTSD
jgi:hypothetical protein